MKTNIASNSASEILRELTLLVSVLDNVNDVSYHFNLLEAWLTSIIFKAFVLSS